MRMKTFTKAVALFVVMALMMVMTISAATVTDVEVTLSAADNKSVEITAAHPDGAAAAGKTINVVVTDGTTDVYWNDATVGTDGRVTFTFEMDPDEDATGTYGVNIGGDGLELNASGDAATGDTFTFVNTTDAAAFIGAVNDLLDATEDSLDADALRSYIQGNTDDFDGDGNNATQFDINCAEGSDYAATRDASKADIAELLAGGSYTEDHEGYYAFLETFNTAVVISLLNDGVATDVVSKYKNVFGFETAAVPTFDPESTAGKYALLTPAQHPAVQNALLGKGFDLDDVAAVKDAFDEAVALALYNDMNHSTKGNLVDYITYTNEQGYTNSVVMSLGRYNALTDTYRDMVRDAMANKTYVNGTYADFEALGSAFDAALDAAEIAYNNALNNTNPGPSGPSGPSSTITVTPVAPVAPAKDMFDDLGAVEWAKEAINALAKDGIVNGVANRTFDPNGILTREQFVKILVGALDIKASGNTPFTDVVASEWYANFVAIAYNSGIVNGTSDTEFGVGVSLTREQLCTMVYRAIKALGIELKMVNSSANFVDSAEISDWAKEAVDYLYRAGVVNGVGGNAFDPQGTTTRAMGAKVIYGVLEGGVK